MIQEIGYNFTPEWEKKWKDLEDHIIYEIPNLEKYGWVGSNSNVVEIGSGSNPNPRSNVLVELEDDGYHRDFEKLKIMSHQRIVWGDICKGIPEFIDKQFDFSYCVHVLEHVQYPEAACKELMRISKSGYLETPGPFLEKVWNFKFHKWYVDVIDGVLTFTDKSLIHKPINIELNQYEDFICGPPNMKNGTFAHLSRFHKCFTRVRWVDSFEVKIIR